MAITKLTEKTIRSLPLGSGIWRDTDVKGLMVICHKTTRTFAVQGDVRRNGRHVRSVRIKIDRTDRLPLADARRQAKALMSQIQSGVDPSAKEPESGITLEGALQLHLKENELRPRTEQSYRYHVDQYLGRFRRRAITDISRNDIRELLDTLTTRHGRTTASGVLRTVRALINSAMRFDETIRSNPVDAIKVPIPPTRKVGPLDLCDWWRKTGRLSANMRDLHRTMLLTGARRTSVLLCKRSDFDPVARTLTFRHRKTGGQLVFPTGRMLTRILRERLRADKMLGSEWLFPSPTSASGHITEPKKPGLPSPHALRHHCRTMMIAAGVPYAESALLLGQKLPGASGGYVHAAHLTEALRSYAQKLERHVLVKALKSKYF
jgi:integrase